MKISFGKMTAFCNTLLCHTRNNALSVLSSSTIFFYNNMQMPLLFPIMDVLMDMLIAKAEFKGARIVGFYLRYLPYK